jgi:hypothetical protein
VTALAADPELIAAQRRFPPIRLDTDTPTATPVTRSEPLACTVRDCPRRVECVVILRTGKKRPICSQHARIMRSSFPVHPLPRCEWRGCDALATIRVELGPDRARALRVVVCDSHRDRLAAAYADCLGLFREADASGV